MRKWVLFVIILTNLMLLAITITPATASPLLMFCMKEEKGRWQDESEILHPAVLPVMTVTQEPCRLLTGYGISVQDCEPLDTMCCRWTAERLPFHPFISFPPLPPCVRRRCGLLKFIQLHYCFQTKKTPTRTRDKLSSANWDKTVTTLRDVWFSCCICCLSLTAASSSVPISLEHSGMLLTFSGTRLKLRPRKGVASKMG